MSQLLKLPLSSGALTCVHESPFPCDIYCLDLRELAEKDSGRKGMSEGGMLVNGYGITGGGFGD